jgi:TonB family protein
MKKALLTILLIIICVLCKAQNKEVRIIRLDTINIHGIIYDSFDRPAKRVVIYSKNNYLSNPVNAITNENGDFELHGAFIKDTLKIDWGDGSFKIANNGSRFIEIHLPVPEPHNITSSFGKVVAQRQVKKGPPTEFKIPNDGQLICVVESNARFKLGRDEFIKFVKSEISYPQKAIENNIEGDVEVTFTITRDGSITNVKTIRGLGYGCDEQVMNAVKQSPKWIPAFANGTTWDNEFSVTINFKLTDK